MKTKLRFFVHCYTPLTSKALDLLFQQLGKASINNFFKCHISVGISHMHYIFMSIIYVYTHAFSFFFLPVSLSYNLIDSSVKEHKRLEGSKFSLLIPRTHFYSDFTEQPLLTKPNDGHQDIGIRDSVYVLKFIGKKGSNCLKGRIACIMLGLAQCAESILNTDRLTKKLRLKMRFSG